VSRTIRYRQIADDLRERVAAWGGGRLLPSESDLSAEYDVSRVTVRRALELLREEGLVDSRQGFGWYVSTEPFVQRHSPLVPLHPRPASIVVLPPCVYSYVAMPILHVRPGPPLCQYGTWRPEKLLDSKL
jgi:DNA-binding transcriptional MocR family regulator